MLSRQQIQIQVQEIAQESQICASMTHSVFAIQGLRNYCWKQFLEALIVFKVPLKVIQRQRMKALHDDLLSPEGLLIISELKCDHGNILN